MTGNRLLKIKNLLPLVLLTAVMTISMAAPVSAANVAITGGTNGPDCNSGGYFTPSSLTVQSGDTVTISVPVNDPYSGGMEVHGFPQGSFVVARGASVTTSPLTGNVSYFGTWPSSGCMKGSGTITVDAPAPPNTPPATGGSTGGSSAPTSTSVPAPSAATVKNPAPSGAAGPDNTVTTQPDTASPAPSASAKTAEPKAGAADESAPKSNTQSPGTQNVAAIGGSAVVLLAAAAFVAWRFVVHRRLARPVAQSAAVQSPEVTQPNNDDSNHNQL